MSEVINNREYRQKMLKEMITDLHNGKSLEMVKVRFNEVFRDASPMLIAEMKQSLIKEGILIEEIQQLFDLHASFLKGSIKEIQHPEQVPGHPVHTFKQENIAINKLLEHIKSDLQLFNQNDCQENIYKLLSGINLLWDIDKHYSRKENLLFPYLERYGLFHPTKVMWGYDNDIRNSIKTVKKKLINYYGNKEELMQDIEEAIDEIDEMIFKEESILLPISLENLIEDEWIRIMDESDEIGYCLIEPEKKWQPFRVDIEKDDQNETLNGYVQLATGRLTSQEIMAIFNYLPVDITFIDQNDVVKYFSQSPNERIFLRTKAVIGRKVQNCHPPSSVHIVEKLLNDFKSRKKDSEDFWINMGNMYVLIRYFAVRDQNGEYLGTLEVTQNIKPIQAITGEKRLMDE